MSRQIENAPFANDRWPDALQQYLSYMGLRWRGRQQGPTGLTPRSHRKVHLAVITGVLNFLKEPARKCWNSCAMENSTAL